MRSKGQRKGSIATVLPGQDEARLFTPDKKEPLEATVVEAR